MASRSEEIFIYLQAKGAAKTKRDIDKVADAIERLNNASDDQAKVSHAEARLLEAKAKLLNAESRKRRESTNAIEAETRAKKLAMKAEKDLGNEIENTGKKALKTHHMIVDITKEEIQAKTGYNANIKQNYRIRRAINAKRVADEKATANKIEQIRKEEDAAEKKRASERKKREDQEERDRKAAERERKREERREEQRAARARKRHEHIQSFLNRLAKKEQAFELLRQKHHVLALLEDERRTKRADALKERALQREERRLEQLGKAEERAQQKRERLEKRARKLRNKAFFSMIPHLPHIRPRTMIMAGAIVGILELVPLLAGALNTLMGVALAAANALGQMSGVLIGLPAALLASAQGIGVFAMAFSGLGEAMTDIDKFNQLGPSAQNLVTALNQMKPAWGSIRDTVRESLLDGLGQELLFLGQYYLPLLNKELNNTARLANTAMRNFSGWMASREGRSVSGNVMATNSILFGNGMDAGQRFLQTFLLVLNAASPMLRTMSEDIVTLSHNMNNWAAGNQGGLASWFSSGYDMFKSTMSVLGDFAMGMYNIIKLASPLTEHIGGTIADAASSFRDWTESEGGIAAISKYFQDMKPTFDALWRFGGRFFQGLFNIGQNADFVDILDRLGTDLIPAFEELFASMDGSIIDLLVQVVESFTKLAENGVLDGFIDAFVIMGGVIEKLLTLIGHIPAPLLSGLVTALLFGSVAKSIIGGVGGFVGGIQNWRNAAGAARAAGAGGLGAAAAGAAGMATGGGVLATGAAAAGGAALTAIPDGKGGFIMAPMGAGGSTGSRTGRGADPRRAAGTTRGSSGPGRRGMGRFASMRQGLRNAMPSRPSMPGGLKGMGGGLGLLALTLGLGPAVDALTPKVDVTKSGASASAMMQYDRAGADPFFRGENGKSIVRGKGFGFEEVNSVSSAAKFLANPSLANKIDSKISDFFGLFGATTATDKVTAGFSQIDDVLMSLPTDKAAEQFKVLQEKMEKEGMTKQEIIDKFPQYRDAIYNTLDPMDKLGLTAEELARRMSGATGSMYTTVGPPALNTDTFQIDPGGNVRVQDNVDMNFAGGLIGAGGKSLVGELGPELAIDRSGQMSLVGARGMQLYSPSTDTAIIPASATSDPLSGNYGNAPEWAKSALQRRLGLGGGSAGGSGGTGEVVTYAPNVNISSSNASAEEIQKAVMRGIKKADRDRRERR